MRRPGVVPQHVITLDKWVAPGGNETGSTRGGLATPMEDFCTESLTVACQTGITNEMPGNPIADLVRRRQLIFYRRASWHADIRVVHFSEPSYGEGLVTL